MMLISPLLLLMMIWWSLILKVGFGWLFLHEISFSSWLNSERLQYSLKYFSLQEEHLEQLRKIHELQEYHLTFSISLLLLLFSLIQWLDHLCQLNVCCKLRWEIDEMTQRWWTFECYEISRRRRRWWWWWWWTWLSKTYAFKWLNQIIWFRFWIIGNGSREQLLNTSPFPSIIHNWINSRNSLKIGWYILNPGFKPFVWSIFWFYQNIGQRWSRWVWWCGYWIGKRKGIPPTIISIQVPRTGHFLDLWRDL